MHSLKRLAHLQKSRCLFLLPEGYLAQPRESWACQIAASACAARTSMNPRAASLHSSLGARRFTPRTSSPCRRAARPCRSRSRYRRHLHPQRRRSTRNFIGCAPGCSTTARPGPASTAGAWLGGRGRCAARWRDAVDGAQHGGALQKGREARAGRRAERRREADP